MSAAKWLRSPLVLIAVTVWIGLNLAAIQLAGGYLPFDRPAMAAQPFAAQMALPTLGLIEIFLLMAVVWVLTRKRKPVDMAARAPDRGRAGLDLFAA
jgi:hypothetical protein